MLKNTYVLNTNDNNTYQITSNTIHSRNRRQVKSTTHKVVKHVQVAQNSLVALSDWEASLCLRAEQILRNKKAMTAEEASIEGILPLINTFYEEDKIK